MSYQWTNFLYPLHRRLSPACWYRTPWRVEDFRLDGNASPRTVFSSWIRSQSFGDRSIWLINSFFLNFYAKCSITWQISLYPLHRILPQTWANRSSRRPEKFCWGGSTSSRPDFSSKIRWQSFGARSIWWINSIFYNFHPKCSFTQRTINIWSRLASIFWNIWTHVSEDIFSKSLRRRGDTSYPSWNSLRR